MIVYSPKNIKRHATWWKKIKRPLCVWVWQHDNNFWPYRNSVQYPSESACQIFLGPSKLLAYTHILQAMQTQVVARSYIYTFPGWLVACNFKRYACPESRCDEHHTLSYWVVHPYPVQCAPPKIFHLLRMPIIFGVDFHRSNCLSIFEIYSPNQSSRSNPFSAAQAHVGFPS